MREIKFIILHSSAQHVGDVNTYHFYISKRGRTHHLYPLSLPGRHSPGLDCRSIGICYAGGMNAEGGLTDTRTGGQKRAMRRLINDLKQLYPQAELREFFKH